MPLAPFSGTLGYKRAAHLLHRANAGATKEQIDSFSGLTAAQAVALLFQEPIPNPALPLDPATNTEWVISGVTDANSGDSDLQEFFKGWFIGQMLGTSIDPSVALAYTTREKIVFFIHKVWQIFKQFVNVLNIWISYLIIHVINLYFDFTLYLILIGKTLNNLYSSLAICN